VAALGAAGYVLVTVPGAHDPGPLERRVFLAINRRGEASRLRWLAQQVGTPWTLPVTAVTAWRAGRPRLAVAALVALGAVKAIEGATKLLGDRHRPDEVVDAPELPDDAPRDGASYPSGHAATAACAMVLLAPEIPGPGVVAAGAVGLVTGLRRVGQGAHFPLDVVGGALLGTGAAGAARLVAGHD
jgi:undecaprenyl-diphosphatase